MRSIRTARERASIVIWTTTPWTIPGNRAIAFSPTHRLRALSRDGRARRQLGQGRRDLHPCAIAGSERLRRSEGDCVRVSRRSQRRCARIHGLRPSRFMRMAMASSFPCSTATMSRKTRARASSTPRRATGARTSSSGRRARGCSRSGASTPRIPYTVDENGALTDEAPGFEGKRVITDKGKAGDANKAVIDALIEADTLVARGKLKHQYPHSWRSKTPVIFRNTPQWFLAMDQPFANAQGGKTLRALAVDAIERRDGRRRPARTGSRAWSPTSPTGCCPASAPGAFRYRFSSARTVTKSCSTKG